MEQALEKLFESNSKIKLLKLFLMNPEQEFALAEITKHTQLKSSAIKKELAKLLKISLVNSKNVNIPGAKKITKKRPKRKIAPKKLRANKKGTTKNKHTTTILKRKRMAKKRK